MNSFYKQMSALIMCAMVVIVVPVHGMENEVEVVVVEQETPQGQDPAVVWYKQRSVQIAAAAITTAAAIYSFAVYKGKVSSPALLCAGLFCAQVAKTIATTEQNNNVTSESNSNQNPPINLPGNDTTIVIAPEDENNEQINPVNSVVVLQNKPHDNQLNEQGAVTDQSSGNNNSKQNSQNIKSQNITTDNKKLDDNRESSDNKKLIVENDTTVVLEIDESQATPFMQLRNGFNAWKNLLVQLKDEDLKTNEW